MDNRQGRNLTPFSHYCIIRDDKRLRDILKAKMMQKEIDYKVVAKELGLDTGNVNKFLNKGIKSISQHNVIRIANLLGLHLEVNIEILE